MSGEVSESVPDYIPVGSRAKPPALPWSAIRERVLERDRRRCRVCTLISSLNHLGKPCVQVHHIVPKSKGGTDAYENLVALCEGCHQSLRQRGGIPQHHGRLVMLENVCRGYAYYAFPTPRLESAPYPPFD